MFTVILSPKDEDLHVDERSREQISSAADEYERSDEMNCGRKIVGAKIWEELLILIQKTYSYNKVMESL